MVVNKWALPLSSKESRHQSFSKKLTIKLDSTFFRKN